MTLHYFRSRNGKSCRFICGKDESSTEGDLASSMVVLLRCSHSAQFVPPAHTVITPVVDRDDGGDLSGWAGPQKGHPTRSHIHVTETEFTLPQAVPWPT